MKFRFAYAITSSAAEVLGVPIYGNNPPWFIKWLHRRLLTLDAILWWFRYRYVKEHQYHLVCTGLPPGFYDDDYRMLYACMSLLSNHVNAEYSPDSLQIVLTDLINNSDPEPTEDDVRQTPTDKEILRIYHWWTVERPANHKHMDEWSSKLFGGAFEKWVDEEGIHRFSSREPKDYSLGREEEFFAFQDRLETEDQNMLHRLIDVRLSLWT